jgi:indole-3-glycerol phosphate synthase
MMVHAGAVALSVLTQPHLFAGSLENLARVRKEVSVPIIMKDIVVSRIQIDAAKKVGADCVLLIKTVFDLDLAEESLDTLMEYSGKKGLQVLVEVHTERELEDLLSSALPLIGINNRNLDTLKIDLETTKRLLRGKAKGKSLVISESGISSAADIRYLHDAGADAYLVGTSIMQSADVSRKVQELYHAY